MRAFGFVLLLLGIVGAGINLWWWVLPANCEAAWACAWAAPMLEKAHLFWLVVSGGMVVVGKQLSEPD